jgi:hypothetical protein
MSEKYRSFRARSSIYLRAKVIVIIGIVLMISAFYGLFFYFQDITETDLKNNLFA